MVAVGREFMAIEAQQGGAVPFHLAADIVVLTWHEGAAAPVAPGARTQFLNRPWAKTWVTSRVLPSGSGR